MKAPLLIGTDLTAASDATLATLGNQGAIAINQDRLGVQGTLKKYDPNGAYSLWSGPLSGGCTVGLAIHLGPDSVVPAAWAAATLKPTATASVSITATWEELGIKAGTSVSVVDVWSNATVAAKASGTFTFNVAISHGNAFYKFCPLLI